MTDIQWGFAVALIVVIVFVFGCGMVLGNWLAYRLQRSPGGGAMMDAFDRKRMYQEGREAGYRAGLIEGTGMTRGAPGG